MMKVLSDANADHSMCLAYLEGLYEGWKEGNSHGVVVAHVHAPPPRDSKAMEAAFESMSPKELEAVRGDLKTDVPCVPEHMTFGDLLNTAVAYFQTEEKRSPFAAAYLTANILPDALRSAFPCSNSQKVAPEGH